jgi:predicted peptidase
MKKLTYFYIILFIGILPLKAQDAKSAFEKHVFEQENITLPYRLLKPKNMEAGKNYPLLIFLHGAGERGDDNEVNLMYISELLLDEKNRKDFPAYVLIPQCPKDLWWINFDRQNPNFTFKDEPSQPMAAVIAVLDQLEKKEAIDKSRMYVSGLSMGGFGTWDLIARFPNRFAAAAPVCGGADVSTAPKIAPMPIWNFHGAEDAVVKVDWSRNMVEALKAVNGNIKYTEYPNVNHDSWLNAFAEPDFLSWLFSHKLK